MQDWFISSRGKGLSSTVAGFSVVGLGEAADGILRSVGVDVEAGSVAAIIVAGIEVIGWGLTGFGVLRKLFFKVVRRSA